MRRDGYPPKAVLATLISHWKETWPDADLSLQAVQRLYPWIVAKWQEGWPIDKLAGSACHCEGNRVVPSEAARRVSRRPLTVPPEVEPGTVFGAEELRDASFVAKLKSQAKVAALQLRQLETALEIAYSRKSVAGPTALPKIEAAIERLNARKAAELARKADIDQRLAGVKSGAPVSRKPKTAQASAAKAEKPARKPKAAKAEKAEKPKTEKPKTEKPKADKPKPAAEPSKPAASKDESFDMNATEDLIAKLFDDNGPKGMP